MADRTGNESRVDGTAPGTYVAADLEPGRTSEVVWISGVDEEDEQIAVSLSIADARIFAREINRLCDVLEGPSNG